MHRHATLEHVIDERSQADRILIAQLHGTAKRHAKWRELTEPEHAAVVGELSELAASRDDLLAETAGLIEGFSEGQLDEPLVRQAAALCRAAGADPEAIPAWIEVGRERRRSAGRPPFSGATPRPRQLAGLPGRVALDLFVSVPGLKGGQELLDSRGRILIPGEYGELHHELAESAYQSLRHGTEIAIIEEDPDFLGLGFGIRVAVPGTYEGNHSAGRIAELVV